MRQKSSHLPVLLAEVLQGLSPQKGETVLDVTLGLGGHSASFLHAIGEQGHLIGMDADAENLEQAKTLLRDAAGEKTFYHCNFCEIPHMNLPLCDVVFADLGLSSPHLDTPSRGFSFRFQGPLDLRFDRTTGETAAELVEHSSEEQLRRLLRNYGEVQSAGALSAYMVLQKPKTTTALKECVEHVCGFRAKNVLPQVFQALRMAVNDELGSLRTLLQEGPALLQPGGRMGIISFHSLEDRMVKLAFRALSTPTINATTGAVTKKAPFVLLTKKGLVPTSQEIHANPRARSARLRLLQKTF
ncbi:16S rRNA (cytosine(1402)-N(4))-methyltransferase [Candidatus Peregrinibacteria bacterium CG10_big_fil_rev_8_21_14_0_10_49_10]|nr:MAG: 16S rRNA (cytosine(1402)-N(4))-methyltransferase [Candidatus Peregrinibacteria bacterium CG10_big_fil_rev_8_21_14_0_10_49_10]